MKGHPIAAAVLVFIGAGVVANLVFPIHVPKKPDGSIDTSTALDDESARNATIGLVASVVGAMWAYRHFK